MSRIGNAIITLPVGTEISVSKENVVTAKGKLGELTQAISPEMTIKIEDGILSVARPSESKEHKAQHGLSRALINNLIIGVSEGYKKELELVGVGYRATTAGQLLEMALGFSHPIVFQIPSEVTVVAETTKGQPPLVTLTSSDKQLIGQVAAKIRSFRKPEPYKGKGIRFKGEEIRRKAGKTA